VRRIAARARDHELCTDCGAGPGQTCDHPGPGRSVCKARYAAAAVAVRQQHRGARRTPEQQGEAAAVLAGFPSVSPEEAEAARSPRGGWTRPALAGWGVPWPPPSGWLRAVLREDGGE
jgi:hypothetical protein